MADWSNSSTNSIYDEAAKKMTQTTTYHLAATLIMDKNFPNRDDLPPVIPTHFNNFGHQLFLDYSLLLKIIWQVIDDIQQSTKKLTRIINLTMSH